MQSDSLGKIVVGGCCGLNGIVVMGQESKQDGGVDGASDGGGRTEARLKTPQKKTNKDLG